MVWKKHFKKLTMVMLIGSGLLLTGCNDKIPPNYRQNAEARITQNQEYLDKMYELGFITQKQAKNAGDALNKALMDQLSQIVKEDGSANTEADVSAIATALRRIRTSPLTNVAEFFQSQGVPGKGDSITIQETLGLADYKDTFKDIAKVELYALTSFGAEKDFDKLMAAITQYDNSTKSESDYNTYLAPYFSKLVDDKGEAYNVSLADPIVMTERNGSENNEFNKDFLVYGYYEDGQEEDENGVMQTRYRVAPAIDIVLCEVNKEFVDQITALTDGKSKDYIFHKDNSGGVRLLLLTYPITYMTKMEYVTDGNSKNFGGQTVSNQYMPVLAQSDSLFINVKDGKLKKKTSDLSGIPVYEDVVSKGVNLFPTTITDAQENAPFRSDYSENVDLAGGSFILSDTMKTKLDIAVYKTTGEVQEKFTGLTVPIGTILLRDYMEVQKMEDVVAGEDWVLTGRKFRFEKLIGVGDTVWARYIDNAGYPYPEAFMPGLMLTDFISPNSEEKTTDKRMKFHAYGKTGEGSENIVWINGGLLAFQVPSPGTLKSPGGTLIEPKVMASDYIEKDTTARPVFYAIKTDKNLFETKLYAEWIGGEDENNSLTWWNTWLKENGFSYQLDNGYMTDYFLGNYGYAGIEEGTIYFDMKTLRKLQEELQGKEDILYARTIRTAFVGIGAFLMFYGLLLITAWVFDVNIVFGPKLLGLLTFGKWVAVYSKEDADQISDSVHFVTLRNVIGSSIGIAFLGVFLVTFNILELIRILISVVGTIATTIFGYFFQA